LYFLGKNNISEELPEDFDPPEGWQPPVLEKEE
jgi:hypothetical protein